MTYLSENISVVQQPTDIPIVLGSSSSNRHAVLNLCGWIFDVVIPDIDEKAIRHDDPYMLPVIIAKAKVNKSVFLVVRPIIDAEI
jgi:predicted house-cleaning NTP pyrophosphatase (Maf/HAM1 superfamily)